MNISMMINDGFPVEFASFESASRFLSEQPENKDKEFNPGDKVETISLSYLRGIIESRKDDGWYVTGEDGKNYFRRSHQMKPV